MKKRIIGIDFGTSNTLIWTSLSEQLAFDEPTVLIWDNTNKKVMEIGYLAHKLIGKVPQGFEALTPIKNGVVADKDAAYNYLKTALKRTKLDKIFKKSIVIFSTPSLLTPVEKGALIEVATAMKAKEVYLANSAKLSAIGSGIDIFSTRGNMIVDIGGSTTDIATVTMGKVVVTKSSNYAGRTCDEAIGRYIRTKHHLIIGEKTAEYIKMKIGTLLDTFDNNLLEVNGKDVITGLPHSIIVSTAEIQEVLIKIYDEITNLIIDTLETSPAEISSDIIHTGITVSGGGCLLNGTREYFQTKLSVPIHISPYPLESTIQGIKNSWEQIIEENI